MALSGEGNEGSEFGIKHQTVHGTTKKGKIGPYCEVGKITLGRTNGIVPAVQQQLQTDSGHGLPVGVKAIVNGILVMAGDLCRVCIQVQLVVFDF